VADHDEDTPAVLAMDWIRVTTLVTLAVLTVVVIAQSAYLVTYVQSQRQVNECYQGQIETLLDWAESAVAAGRSDRQAQRELLLSRDAGIDGRSALDRYLSELDEADRTRAAATPPTERCSR
jgi:hypothetical protein